MIGVSAVGLMTAALLIVDKHFTHPQIVEHLAFGYMLPIAAVAMLFGSVAGTVATAVSALAAAFFFFLRNSRSGSKIRFTLPSCFGWPCSAMSRVGLREGCCRGEIEIVPAPCCTSA